MSDLILASSQWYYAANKRKTGPLFWDQLRELAVTGQLQPADMVLREGSSKWVQAASVEGLFPLAKPVQSLRETMDEGERTGPYEPAGADTDVGRDRSSVGVTVPGYEILEVLGRGGMGVVYKARQVGLDRLIALKMILAGAHAEVQHHARFRTEAQAVARLQHPNIVQIHEIGEHEGLPFISLEYVEGGSLAGKLRGLPRPARDAAALVETLARAVHAAHEKGIVHRDLKPANVLLAPKSERAAGTPGPDAEFRMSDFEPKIADFGLAKLQEGTEGYTASGAVLGTPSYMAPEQAEGHTADVGPACDIYALGAILYELLTGRPPFKGNTLLETLEQVRTHEPVSPSRLAAHVPPDLETICLKCLEKNPARRYGTAGNLAEDLRRLLAWEPIQARQVGRWERGLKWVRRHPARAVASALTVLVVLVGVGGVGSAWLWQRAEMGWQEADAQRQIAQQDRQDAERARDAATQARDAATEARRQAQEARDRLDQVLYFNRVGLAHREWLANSFARAREELAACPAQLRHWEWGYVHRLCHSEALTFRHGDGSVRASFSPDGKWLATAGNDRLVRVWDPNTGKQALSFLGHTREVTCVAWRPDGLQLASGAVDRTVRIWDVKAAKEIQKLEGHTHIISGVAWHPDGKALASSSWDNSVRVWDVETGKQLLSYTEHDGASNGVAYSPDGKQIVSLGQMTDARIWDAATKKDVFRLKEYNQVVYSPDGKRLAAASLDGTVTLWDAKTGKHLLTIKAHATQIMSLSFSPDGKRLASTGRDFNIKVWDVATGQEVRILRGPVAHYVQGLFSPDGQRLAATASDGTVRIWDANYNPEYVALDDDGKVETSAAAFSPDGQRLATGGGDETVKIWDVRDGKPLQVLRGHTHAVLAVAFSPDGKRLVSAGGYRSKKHIYGASQVGTQRSDFVDENRPGELKIWDLKTGAEVFAAGGHLGGILAVAWSPDGRWLASAGMDGVVKLRNPDTGREVRTLKGHTKPINAVAFSPDGSQVASGGLDGFVRVWDTASGQEILSVLGHPLKPGDKGRTVFQVTVTSKSPKGEEIVEDKVVTITRETDDVRGVAFSPDGKRLASADDRGGLKVWDVKAGREILSLRGSNTAAWSPDGRRLATVADKSGGELTIWETTNGDKALTLKGATSGGMLDGIVWSPDSTRLASFGGKVRLWTAGPWGEDTAAPVDERQPPARLPRPGAGPPGQSMQQPDH